MKISEKDSKKFWDIIDLTNCEVSGNEDRFIIKGGMLRFEDDIVIPDNITFRNDDAIVFERKCVVGDNVIFDNGQWLSFNGEVVFGDNIIINSLDRLYFDYYIKLPEIKFKIGKEINQIVLNYMIDTSPIYLSRNDIEIIMNRRGMLEEM